MRDLRLFTRVLPAILSVGLCTGPIDADGAWLDRPLANWNQPGASISKAPKPESEPELLARCQQDVRSPESAEERAVAAAGWTVIGTVRNGLDRFIITARSDVDGMCRPNGCQAFVFVHGQFAGTLSPGPMNARTDGAAIKVRWELPSQIAVEFARYSESDPLCCPSWISHVIYQVKRGRRGPLVVPQRVKTTRTETR